MTKSRRRTVKANILHRQYQQIGGPATFTTIRFPPPDYKSYDALKSRGRVVFARGPWIESHPLYTTNKERCYKILAYGEYNDDVAAGRTIETECVSGMIFPSSSSSLAYGTDTIASKRRYKALSSISAVAYGGRRISFLSGGGLWNRLSRNQTRRSNQIDTTQIADDFQHISIQRITNNQIIAPCQYLEVPDWIHDVQILDIDCRHSSENESHIKEENVMTKQLTKTITFLIAMAMASNNCEIWAFRSIPCHDVRGMTFSLCPTRLQCIVCDVRCMTYSLSLYGWNDDSIHVDFGNTTITIPPLLAVSGTVFGDIVVWPAIDCQEKSQSATDENLSLIVERWLYSTRKGELPQTKNVRKRVSPIHWLKGHLGSVYSIKISECGNFIASTSDDRTIRLWVHTPMVDQNYEVPDESTHHVCAKQIIDLHSSYLYTLAWTGWGHTARVWDVSIVSATSTHQLGAVFPLLLSAGEDGTIRVWSPLTSTKEITHPLRGNRSSSIWTVNASAGIVVTGGNDGCIKLFTLDKRLKSNEEAMRKLFVPMDPFPATIKVANNKVSNETKASANNKKTKTFTPHENGQAICGMAFYSNCRSVGSEILIATRAGELFSLHTTTNAWCDHSNWSENIVSCDDEAPAAIDNLTGTCTSVHPGGKCALIGTSEGWLVKSSLIITASSNKKTNFAFCAQSYRSIQSISFPDEDSLLAFYARGVIIWFKFDQSPTPLHVMKLGTTGIPLSFAHDNDIMYFGDSRGNIAYFSSFPAGDINHVVSVCEQKPSSLLAKVHGKEHVIGLAVSSSGILLSVGNDGCLSQSKIDSKGQLQKLMSVPIANVTGLRHIWNVPNSSGIEQILIGGFYGNDYVLLDSVYGELLRIDTGGRQRRQDVFINVDYNTGSLRSFEVVILTGQKDGINSIDIYNSDLHDRDMIRSIGIPFHAENINDASWIEDDCGNLFLLTGSNDCTVKLSRFNGNEFVSTVDLPPHESCVRGVCSSGRLLVTCGGKFSMEFYILDCTSTTLSGVALLCSYRTQGNVTTDHRFNSVRATALFPLEKKCHLVLAGDSDGDLHLCIISEQVTPRRTVIGTKLNGDGRPILCLELLRCNSTTILAFVGTTGGKISVWVLPGIILCDSDGTLKPDGAIPCSPVYFYIGHKSGVNDIGVLNANNNRSTDTITVIIASVGDDQALSTGILEFFHMPSAQLHLASEILLTRMCTDASALKGISIIDSDSNFYRIYTIHSSKITLWHLSINNRELSIKYVSSSSLGTEGSCVDCIRHKRADGSVHELIAVGGEGVAVLSLNLDILRAARKLHEANYLMITAGAGFSADSGLQTYDCGPAEYRAMCDPSKLLENSFDFQQYWLKFTKSYLETLPHVGYDLLDHWCNGRRLRNLNNNSNNLSGWWVYTSNVDGFFRRFQSFAESLCEIHGSVLMYRCACAIGYSNGESRLGQEWQQWNKQIHSKDECKQTSVEMSLELLNNLSNSDQVFHCSHCQCPMRPNVLMFNDNDVNVLDPINIERERYQTWESAVEDDVSLDDQNLVILELGCGVTVPAVRQESMDVMMDCAKKIRVTGHGSLCLIRINPKDAIIHNDDDSLGAISVTSTAASALQQIDVWINVFNNS